MPTLGSKGEVGVIGFKGELGDRGFPGEKGKKQENTVILHCGYI